MIPTEMDYLMALTRDLIDSVAQLLRMLGEGNFGSSEVTNFTVN